MKNEANKSDVVICFNGVEIEPYELEEPKGNDYLFLPFSLMNTMDKAVSNENFKPN